MARQSLQKANKVGAQSAVIAASLPGEEARSPAASSYERHIFMTVPHYVPHYGRYTRSIPSCVRAAGAR